MKSIQEFTSKVTNFFTGGRREDGPQRQSDPQPQMPQSKKLDSDDAFRNPDGSPGAIPSSNTDYVDKPAIVNKIADASEMNLKLPTPKQ
jgi:hypothetical protein